MRVKRIHHITLAVRNAGEAAGTFAALFGADPGDESTVPAFGVRTLDVLLGNGAFQLAAPLHTDSPVQRFIERKGEGVYNVALEVDDLDAAVVELIERGVRVSDPVDAPPGMRSAFVSTRATHGVSIQLVELTTRPEDAPASTTSSPVALAGAPGSPATSARESSAPESPPEPTASDDPPELWTPPDQQSPGAPPPLDLTPDEWSDVD
jgi:methylmalonyl-CoA epimerase